MARPKKNIEVVSDAGMDDAFSAFAKDSGGEVIDSLSEARYFIDTGNLAINYCYSGKFINGGIPGGRVTEIYGPSASSKSLIGSNILHGCQKLGGAPFLLDVENAVNKEFLQIASRCNTKRMVRYTPETLERCFSKITAIMQMVRKDKRFDGKPIVILYDSISGSPCEREFRETNLPENYTPEQYKKIVGGKEQPGERAKVCSREFRKIMPLLEKYDATLVVLNQTRDKIGVKYGSPETTGGGGNALIFYASLRARPQAQAKIEKSIKGLGKKKKTVGVYLKMSNKKNRSHRPFVEVDGIPLYFDRGVNPLGGLLGALLDAERVTPSSGKGCYAVKPEFTGSEEPVTFKTSSAKNTVPLDVLLKYPKLLDVDTEQQVKDYLLQFGNAIEDVESDAAKEDADELVSEIFSEDEEEELDKNIVGNDDLDGEAG